MCPFSGLCLTMVSLESLKTAILTNNHLIHEGSKQKQMGMVLFKVTGILPNGLVCGGLVLNQLPV